jgi:hypothetical protein
MSMQCRPANRLDTMARSAVRNTSLPSLNDEIAHLRGLDLRGLRARWRSVFRRTAPPHLPRHLLFAILAYRLQADAFGDLAPETVRLLRQIATSNTATAAKRLTAPFDRQRSGLKPGTVLTREWNGQIRRVTVLDEGFAWEGKTYDSLSRVALAITGTRWNGPRFFGLRDQAPVEQAVP